jgi:hypothetical protein
MIVIETSLDIINSLQCPVNTIRFKFSTAMIISTASTVIAVLVGSFVVEQVQCASAQAVKKKADSTSGSSVVNGGVPPHCFPAVGFKMPKSTPTSLTNWWCNTDTEYAFVGFSYDISSCEFFYEINLNVFYMIMLTVTAISFLFFRSESGPTEN